MCCLVITVVYVNTLSVLGIFKENVSLRELLVAPSSTFGSKCSGFTFLVLQKLGTNLFSIRSRAWM
jgi:hypothetical protein